MKNQQPQQPKSGQPDLESLLALYEQFSPGRQTDQLLALQRAGSSDAEDAVANEQGYPTLQAMSTMETLGRQSRAETVSNSAAGLEMLQAATGPGTDLPADPELQQKMLNDFIAALSANR